MFQCDKCSKSYKQRKDLLRHQRVKHAPGGEVQYTCPKCGAKYSWEHKLKEHLEKGGCNKRKLQSPTRSPKKSSVRCQVCSRVMKTYEDYAIHSHSHVRQSEIRKCLKKNMVAIEKKSREHKPGACDSYNFPLALHESISPQVIADQLNEIYDKAD